MIEGVDYTKTSWQQLQDFPSPTGETFSLREYSGPLGCDHLAFTVGRLAPGQFCDHHQHAESEEVYILASGHCQIRIADGAIDAEPFDAFRIPPGVDHSVYNNTDETCFWIFMGPRNEEFFEYFYPERLVSN